MDSELPLSVQRSAQVAAKHLNTEAKVALQPLHDALLTESSAFDGIVYYSVDHWHPNNASAVATVQPPTGSSERFQFYRENIEFRRVDLGATALGIALRSEEPSYLQSKMNPKNHTTWATPSMKNNVVIGGLQAAFNIHYGKSPSEKTMNRLWKHYAPIVRDVALDFEALSLGVTSIGDTLELLAPATPNAFIISWDMSGSTQLALDGRYGALRNYLLDAKGIFNKLTEPYAGGYHDTGDGQDMIVWLPDTLDRSNADEIRAFGKQDVLPIVASMNEQQALLATQYQDIQPFIRLVVGLGYIEKDKYDGRTSAEYWEIAKLAEQKPVRPVRFTKAARKILEQQ